MDIMIVLDNWLVLALAFPVIWAVICLIDSCFIGKKIYRSAWDSPVILGPSVTAVALVQSLLPLLIVVLSLMLMRQFLTPIARQTFVLQSEGIYTKSTLLVVTITAVLILQQNGALL